VHHRDSTKPVAIVVQQCLRTTLLYIVHGGSKRCIVIWQQFSVD